LRRQPKVYAAAEAINTEAQSQVLRVVEQYVCVVWQLAKTNNTMILPAELSNIGAAVAAITKTRNGQGASARVTYVIYKRPRTGGAFCG
jgi:hypothetical protein